MPRTVALPPSCRETVRLLIRGRVSSVRIASAKSDHPSVDRDFASRGIAFAIFAIGSVRPMIPVDAAKNDFGGQPHAFSAARVIFSASLRPRAPVTAFAFPLLTMTPRKVFA